MTSSKNQSVRRKLDRYRLYRYLRLIYWDMKFRKATALRIMQIVDCISDQSALIAKNLALIATSQNPRPMQKGEPDLAALKRTLAGQIQDAMNQSAGLDLSQEHAARKLASLDLLDARTFQLFMQIFTLRHQHVLKELHATLKSHVVMHVSCLPRLSRAQASLESFATMPDLSQIIVVGGGYQAALEYDCKSQVLTLPVPDSYEHLPQKVVTALFVLGMIKHVRCVLKVDDDHRMATSDSLQSFFATYSCSRAILAGIIVSAPFHGAHMRAWHFDKCSDTELGKQPYSYVGAREWVNGAEGYFVSRGALDLILWAYPYFQETIRLGLYEDMVLSSLLERNTCMLKTVPMSRCVAATTLY